MTARTISVTNQSELLVALRASTGGETIILGDGDYGRLTLSRFNFVEQVTIKGGNFASLALIAVKNIKFDDTTIAFSPSPTSTSQSQAIRIASSQDVAITNARITGGLSINGVPNDATVLDSTGNVLGLPVGQAINISFSNGVTISGSDISLFHKGVVMAGSSNILIADNEIHDLRTTPISGSVIANLTITGNHTYNSNPWNYGGTGDHGDRIHIWTDKTPITGLVITNNRLEQGTGSPMMGIYLDDNNKGLGFVDTVVSGNKLTDGHGQGVLLENVSGIVSNNTLVWSGFGNAHSDAPRFDIAKDSHDLTLIGNSGPVSIREGAYDIRVTEHSGTTSLAEGLSLAALESIVLDTKVHTSKSSFTLSNGVSDLTFIGTGDFTGFGNSLDNRLIGGAGNDILIGNGGADVLNGGLGNDTYHVDNLQQTIIDSGGIDTVHSSVGWKLQSGIENLIYTGTTGATLEGNRANNRIVGSSGADTLIANGGVDVLEGGLGNDTYILDSIQHSIIDTNGVDTVITPVSYVLQADLENLTLSGTANATATGNTSDNVLRGNSGRNTIDGGTGADLMYGGAGNDTYVVDNIGDRAIETEEDGADSGGIDLVRSFVDSFILDRGIENLTYVGSGNFHGTGNDLANIITGGSGADRLLGGRGDDRLLGGLGDDILNGGPGADTLIDFDGNDIFVLAKGESHGDILTGFRGNGELFGDQIELKGWGPGTTVTKGVAINSWQITDGIDNRVEVFTSAGAIHPTDIYFGKVALFESLPIPFG